MSSGPLPMTDTLYTYFRAHCGRESDLLRRLRKETAKMPEARMQISPEQGQFMALLVELMDAQRIIEVGTFTGYSSIWMAAAMAPGGKLIACDIDENFTAVARRYWNEAGLSGRIDLRLAPAMETLNGLRSAGGDGSIDLAFIDADKTGYNAYYEACLALLRPGGLILVDNVLWSGAVADADNQTDDTRALRAFNDRILKDSRVTLCMTPIGDGLTLARKRT